MAVRHADEAIQRDGTGTGVKRRGLLAGAAALVAGIAAKQTSQPVTAAPITADSFSANGTATVGYETRNGVFSRGVVGYATLVGVDGFGLDSASYGVSGYTLGTAVNSSGVKGTGEDGVTNGVWGENRGPAQNATGVFGLASKVTTTGPTVGVWGRSQSTSAGSIGTYGEAAAAGAYGVLGRATGAGGNGVYGQSDQGYGVLGYSTGGSASLSGISTNANIPAFAGGNSVAGGLAASFSGTVYVNGRLVVTDPSYKSGMLTHADGSHRLVYCVESPESWIEDFGKGTLTNGKAEVRLDPDFAAVVQTGDYHVFLNPYDGVGALRAARQTAVGFAVEEIGGSTNGRFSYRVVAKPRTEKKTSRLEKFSPPEVKLPDVVALTLPSKPSDGPTEPKAPDARPQVQPPARTSVPAASSPVAAPLGGVTNPVQPAPPPRP
jgi:hypothetical protein